MRSEFLQLTLGPMTPIIFTTAGLPRGEQFDAWRGWFDTVFEVEADDPQEGFLATSKTWHFGAFGLSRVQAPKLRVFRTARLVRRNPIDHWNIVVGHRRTFVEVSRKGSIDLPADTPFVTSLGRELVSFRDEDDRLQLYLPRDTFPDVTAVLEGADGRPLSDAMGKLLGDFIVLLARDAATFAKAGLPGLQNALRGMLLACISPSSVHNEIAAGAIALTRKEIVKRIVDANLSNSALGPDFLCRKAAMSRSQLYRLLESEGGVRNYIQRRRLKQGFAELADGAGTRPINLIAEALGFPDHSSFTRAFKVEFGLKAMDVRHAALSGAPVSPWLGTRLESDIKLRDILDQISHA